MVVRSAAIAIDIGKVVQTSFGRDAPSDTSASHCVGNVSWDLYEHNSAAKESAYLDRDYKRGPVHGILLWSF
jgi:hypothetical protein